MLGLTATAASAMAGGLVFGGRAMAAGDLSAGFDEPYATFAPPSTRLHTAAPEEAGLDAVRIDVLVSRLRGFLEPQGESLPLYPGAVVLAAHDGKVVLHEAIGHAVRYADAEGTEMPADQQVPMVPDTIFDLASITKLFTSIVVMQLVERGLIDINRTVASYLPEFAASGKQDITVRNLLTHTSGLRWQPLWQVEPDRDARIQAAMEATPLAPPGTQFGPSRDPNHIMLGVLAEQVSGQTLDVLVEEGIAEPLGMVDTGYNPPADKLDRIAATEYQSVPPRGMVRGSVHDENAWSLGGVAGNAGVFSTARDLAIFAQAILNGGVYQGQRILARSTVELMLSNFNDAFPGSDFGLGFDLDARSFMGGLSSPRTAGHTGFTGTSVVIDPLSRSFVVLLTNRVHPRREWSNVRDARVAAAQQLAEAVRVTPRRGETAWFSDTQDNQTTTLTLLATLRADSTRLSFEVFVDTEPSDVLVLELSWDGGSVWEPLPFGTRGHGGPAARDGTISGFTGRRWRRAHADVAGPPGDVQIRWRYTTDQLYQGRGVYVDGIRLTDADGVLVDGEREPERFVADGWTEERR